MKLDGTTIYVEAHSAPIRYQESEGTLVFVRNITERKQTEESLLLSEDRYRRLFQAPCWASSALHPMERS